VFQHALQSVIETSGPLHVAFHMLQRIYDIFRMLIEWVAKLLKWQRIKFGKVSDSFQLAQSIVFLILEELEWYLVDVMINIEFDDDDRQCIQNMLRLDKFPVWFAKKYIEFLDSNNWSKNNIGRSYCCNFVVMARKYRMYWNAIRCGDKVVQEMIFCSWIGIFSLLKKKITLILHSI
jgi:hypothetical protein